jgi:hypothetical protein
LSTPERSGIPRSILRRPSPKFIFRKQVSMIPARKTFWEDHSRLDSWHGLKSFQPLESSKGPRGAVYPASAALRHKMNGGREIGETSIDQFPVDMWRLDRLWDVRLGLQVLPEIMSVYTYVININYKFPYLTKWWLAVLWTDEVEDLNAPIDEKHAGGQNMGHELVIFLPRR